MIGLYDLHCHLLPGIDDGAKTPEISMALIEKEVRDGAKGLCFTPHFYYERTALDDFVKAREKAFFVMTERVRNEGVQIDMKCGAEVYFTQALPSLDLRQLAIEGTDYILIELPTSHRPHGVGKVLFEIEQQGYIPILAHVERYDYLENDPTVLYDWVRGGALAQINAASLLRSGRSAAMVRKYIKWNLVHLVCSDAHSPEHRPVNLRDGLDTLDAPTRKLLARNAKKIYRGDIPDMSCEPLKPKKFLGRWVASYTE